MFALFVFALSACNDKDTGDSAPPAPDDTAGGETAETGEAIETGDTGPTVETGDTGPADCGLIDGIALDGLAIPGEPAALRAVDSGSGLAWTAAWAVDGEPVDGDEPTLDWAVPAERAVHTAEAALVSLVASADGCLDEPAELEIALDHPDWHRVVTVYNPSIEGSEDVARHYAAARGLAEAQICGIASNADTTLPEADLDAWLTDLQSCVDGWGAWTHYIAPVYGVPYRVSGRIYDFASGVQTTTSLDALMVFGDGSVGLENAIWNPLFQGEVHGEQSRNQALEPWVPFGELREALGYDYYLVARLDGAGADAAVALIDRTLAAESLTLSGTVYVDGRYGDTPPEDDSFGSYEYGEWNMWGTRYLFEELGWYPVVWDGDPAEFGTAPAPLECPDALYYAGWYSYYNYNDAFTWAPGAIGGHLDSCSACDIRSDATWAGGALQRGITATFGAVAEPYVAGMPEYDQFFLYLTSGASYAEAGYQSTALGAWMMTWVGDPIYRPYGP